MIYLRIMTINDIQRTSRYVFNIAKHVNMIYWKNIRGSEYGI